MRLPRIRRVVLATIIAAVTGCSLAIDTSGLTGGPSVADSGGIDAPSAGDAAESGAPPNESGTSDEAAVVGCSGHLFCDNFDGPDASLPGGWDNNSSEANPLTLDTSTFVSGPRSLHASITPVAGNRRVTLSKKFEVAEKTLRFEFDYRYDPQGNTFDEIDPYQLGFEPPPPNRTRQSIAMVNYKSGPGLEHFLGNATGGPTLNDVSIAAEANKWLHVRIVVDFSATPATCKFDIDGDTKSYNLEGTKFDSVTLEIGAPYYNEAQVTWDFRFDNVVVDSP